MKRGNHSHARVRTALSAIMICGIVLTAAQVAAIPAADAMTFQSVMSSSGVYRLCVDTALPGCQGVETIPSGRKLHLHCWAKGTPALGTDRYFYVTTERGSRGFVIGARVANQTTVGKCSEHAGVAAARWTAEHVGRVDPTAGEKIEASHDRWSGWCLTFVVQSFRLTTGKQPIGRGTAQAAFDTYRQNGRVSTNLDPSAISIGSMVFYRTSSGTGHVVTYVGGGLVVGTQGTEASRLPVGRFPLDHWGAPIGWVAPGNV